MHSRGTFMLKEGIHPSNGLMIHTLTHHTVRLSKAILIGADAGLDVELMPQIRTSMECAVTAAWLLVTKDAGLALTREGARQRKAALEGMVSFGHDASESLAETLQTFDNLFPFASGEGASFEKRCKALEGGAELYLTYRAASLYAHAGMGIADHYVTASPSPDPTNLGLMVNTGAQLETIETWIAFQACMLLIAQKACDTARARAQHRTQLAKAAKRLGIVGELPLRQDDGGSPRSESPEGDLTNSNPAGA